MEPPTQSKKVDILSGRWRAAGHIFVSFLIGFVGFIWGGMAVSHLCYKDIPFWKISIHVTSAVGAGYLWYMIPRWYYKLAALAVFFGIVSIAGEIYLREVHK